MPKRIVLDREYIARVKKDNAPLMAAVATMEQKKIPCKFCKLRTIDKYEDLQGHFSAFCNRCGQVAVYNAADYRHYSYLPHTRPVATTIARTRVSGITLTIKYYSCMSRGVDESRNVPSAA